MPLSRELGRYFRVEPLPELTSITGPQRPTPGRWSPEAWAEIQAIYATPDPFEEK